MSNEWGEKLSGFMYVECSDCNEKYEAEVLDGEVTFPADLYWVRIPYNGDTEHLSPVCWDCAIAEYGAKFQVKPKPAKKIQSQRAKRAKAVTP